MKHVERVTKTLQALRCFSVLTAVFQRYLLVYKVLFVRKKSLTSAWMVDLEGLACTQCFLNWQKALLLLCLLTKGILSSFENLQNLLDLCRTKVTEGLCRAKILLTLLPFSPQPVVQCTESSPCVHWAGDPGDAWWAGKSTECCGKSKPGELFRPSIFTKQGHCGGHIFWESQPTLFKCGGNCGTG